MTIILLITFLLCERLSTVSCSVGDRSHTYQKCLNNCVRGNCSEDGSVFSRNAQLKQDIWSSLLLWSCRDECSYQCMWRSVAKFEQMGHETPKFHGKWPFVKLLGIQEPASACCSLLNLAAHVYMYRKLRREFPMRHSALVMFWHLFVFVCINAWLWSTIFHTRDKPFTEFMDYACALSMVVALFAAAIVRVFRRRREVMFTILAPALFYLVQHVLYLYSGQIDYDYNMNVNVFYGVAGSCVWLCWSGVQLAAGRRHARSMLQFTALSGAALALELLDFPPVCRAWDAHALWHLSTAPLPLLFYRFVIDDLRYLQSGQHEKLDLKIT